jgi:cobalt/nickel transport system permease protein
MHIPDGYLSPVTDGVMLAAAAPFWVLAFNRVRRKLSQRTVPVLALFAAFSFVMMMFNVPLPGGTTAHAVGGTLLAIVLGPWEAVIGISVVLGIQAVFFGDGGILAYGANCFNMAVVLPLAGYFVYKLISAGSEPSSPRRIAGAFAGGYLGINAAALFTSVELGLQPLLFHTSGGTPLYAPYNLAIAVPAVVSGHLLMAGPLEGLVTGMVVFYLQRAKSPLVGSVSKNRGDERRWILWGGLAALALAAPIGLLASGTAWGEWGLQQLKTLGLGFVPAGLQNFQGWWHAPLPGYGFPRIAASVGYVLSAFIGIGLVAGMLWVAGKALVGKTSPSASSVTSAETASRKNGSFLSKNIESLSGALESAMTADDRSRAAGFLQGLDPRVKITGFVLFIIAAGLLQHLVLLGVLFGVVLLLAFFSKVPLLFFIRRVLLFIPLFTAVIAVPALFTTPGTALLHIGSHLSVSNSGIQAAAFLLARVTTSLSLGILLVMTTPWTGLLASLRWFRLPSLVVSIVGMTYRYIYLFLHTANNIFLARRSRTVARFSRASDRRWLGQVMAAALTRSQHLSEEVYLAMLSRGYTGEIVAADKSRVGARDFLYLAGAAASTAIILWMNYR